MINKNSQGGIIKMTSSSLTTCVMLFFLSLVACQGPEKTEAAAMKEPEEAPVDSVRLAARRPAPDFYVLTPEIYKNRVYICDDIYSDIFHVQYDCKELAGCTGSTKNVTLVSAVRDNGRYNCQACSSDLGHIFDDKLIR
ncbi:hypothetical protein [Botryobacter ruber]|uniref:hypothetical protein n=1 Tax=Botryobacter ruber TaxID=2171629 RepID=UPI000F65582B|nr:hypothetical protein [Botryobacter ruber]